MAKILVTGGLGFIGSHTTVELMAQGHQVVIIDNLSNSSIEVLDGIERIAGKRPHFEQIDLREKQSVENFFQRNTDIDGVIHFAASKAVGESVEKPLLYYENNVSALVYLLQNAVKNKQMNFIFSSSCTVYGQADTMPITEEAPVKKATSPYGNTKQIDEEILSETAFVSPNLRVISLRYFNPIGAHPSGEIGELPLGIPQNLIPFITQTAAGIRSTLSVFGDDYPTSDGTCIRDYIYVVDLAKAHVKALERLLLNKQEENYEVFNVGTGKGNSVLEVIKSFETVAGEKLPYQIVARRQGDVVSAYADTTKAQSILGWKAEHSLEYALDTAWKWQQRMVEKSKL